MKKVIFLSLAVAIAGAQQLYAQTPTIVWAKSMGGIVSDVSTSLTIDAKGNVYTTGLIEDSVDFDPGPDSLNLMPHGKRDFYIQKLDAVGNLVWAVRIGGYDNEGGNAIAVDTFGNVYVTGDFRKDEVDFDPGQDTFLLDGWDYSDIFIMKLNASGDFMWAKRIGGGGIDDPHSIAVDIDGNVYSTGYYENTVDFDPGLDTFYLSAGSYRNVYIHKLDTDGNFLWVKSIEHGYGQSLDVDDTGNICITGTFGGTTDFDPGPDTFKLTTIGFEDIFILKLDASGSFQWAKQIGGAYNDYTYCLKLDTSGNIYTTGAYGGTVDFDPGGLTYNLISNGYYDVFVQKLDASGNFIWAKSLGGGGNENGYSSGIDASGNVYTTGYFQGAADFDPGPNTFYLFSNGSYDAFINKLDAAGNFQWAINIGSADYDEGRSVAADASGNVYATGYFTEVADFDPGMGTYNLTSNGLSDIFILKWSQSLVNTTQVGFENEVNAYPNPTSGNITIDLGADYKDIQLKITSISGQVIFEKFIPSASLINENVEGPAGIYFVSVRDESGKQAFGKVIKE